jgi:hypothetical protein
MQAARCKKEGVPSHAARNVKGLSDFGQESARFDDKPGGRLQPIVIGPPFAPPHPGVILRWRYRRTAGRNVQPAPRSNRPTGSLGGL